MTLSLRWLFHNVVAHPVCGALWFAGVTRLADAIHEATAPHPTTEPHHGK